MIFLLHVEWPEMPPYQLLLTYYVWRIVWRPWRPFLGHQAWSWTTLKIANVFLLRLTFFIFVTLFTFLTFFKFIFELFLHLFSGGVCSCFSEAPLRHGQTVGREGWKSKWFSGAAEQTCPVLGCLRHAAAAGARCQAGCPWQRASTASRWVHRWFSGRPGEARPSPSPPPPVVVELQ